MAEECTSDTPDLKSVGFKALLTVLAVNESYNTDEIITNFQPKEFTPEAAKETFAQLVHQSREVSNVEPSQMSAELPGPLQASLEALVTTQQEDQEEEDKKESLVKTQPNEQPVAQVQEDSITPQGEKHADKFILLAISGIYFRFSQLLLLLRSARATSSSRWPRSFPRPARR